MILNYPSQALPNATYTVNGYCDSSESYRTNPIITGSWYTGTTWSGKKSGEITGYVSPSNPSGRTGFYINIDSNDRQSIVSSGTNACGIYYSTGGGTSQTSGQIPSDVYNYTYEQYFDNAVFETNIPIFDTLAHREAYVTAQTDAEALEILEQYAINYKKDICYISCVALPTPPGPEFKTWAHFDGQHILVLGNDWYSKYDHKVTFEWYDDDEYNDCFRFGDNDASRLYCRRRYSQYYMPGPGIESSQYWSGNVGVTHLMINNDEEHKNYIDGNYIGIVGSWNDNSSNKYCIAGRDTAGNYKCPVYVKQFKIESISTGDVLMDLKPCIFEGTHYLYDAINGTYYAVEGLECLDNLPS